LSNAMAASGLSLFAATKSSVMEKVLMSIKSNSVLKATQSFVLLSQKLSTVQLSGRTKSYTVITVGSNTWVCGGGKRRNSGACLLLLVLSSTRAEEARALVFKQGQIAAGGNADLQGRVVVLVSLFGSGKDVAVWSGKME